MTNETKQTQIKAIAILIGLIVLAIAMHKSMVIFLVVCTIPLLWIAYGGIYLMLIRNQKKRKKETVMS